MLSTRAAAPAAMVSDPWALGRASVKLLPWFLERKCWILPLLSQRDTLSQLPEGQQYQSKVGHLLEGMGGKLYNVLYKGDVG